VNEDNEIELREYLKKNVPTADLEMRQDLWPAMARRLEKNEKRVPWFDWVLLGAAAACLIFVPQIIPMLLYHL
jgi:hypothetical protein